MIDGVPIGQCFALEAARRYETDDASISDIYAALRALDKARGDG
jgi:hypothetical protein